MKHVVTLLLIFLSGNAYSQYWFGPKAGLNYTDHFYQESRYERDSFNIAKDINFQFGVALNYTATDLYSVYTEIVYERIGKHVKDLSGGDIVSAKMTNNFISIPVMLRVSLGRVPFHYYINGGPKLSYWLSGNGVVLLDEFKEFRRDPTTGEALPFKYKVSFRSAGGLQEGKAHIERAERLKFGIVVGGGGFFDLENGARLMVDLRYNWGHSNLAFNYARDLSFDSYRENLEYTHNIASISVGYLFAYNSSFKRKGKSTNRESNKK